MLILSVKLQIIIVFVEVITLRNNLLVSSGFHFIFLYFLFGAERKKTELFQELSLQARDLRFQHQVNITPRNNKIIMRMEVRKIYENSS